MLGITQDSDRSRKCHISSYQWKINAMLCVMMSLVIAATSLIYLLSSKKPSQMRSQYFIDPYSRSDWFPLCPSPYINSSEQFDCNPQNIHSCESKGCCFVRNGKNDVKCVYPRNYGYKIDGNVTIAENAFELPLKRLGMPSRYGNDFDVARVLVEEQMYYQLRIKFYDPASERYEVPFPDMRKSEKNFENKEKLFIVKYNASQEPFSLQVQRRSSETTVFDTSIGALLLSHQLLEVSILTPSENIFGLGQEVLKFKQNIKFSRKHETWQLFSTAVKKGYSGVHPFYMCIENDGNAHGVLLLNSNAMEVTLSSKPAVTFQTIGGILDFYIFLGPTPDDVIKQYTEAVGRPMLPPYWSLGTQLLTNDLLLHKYEDDIPIDVILLDSKDWIFNILDKIQSSFFDIINSRRNGTINSLLNGTINSPLNATINSPPKLVIMLWPMLLAEQNHEEIKSSSLTKLLTESKSSPFLSDKYGKTILGKLQFSKKDVVYIDFGTSAGYNIWSDLLSWILFRIPIDGIRMVDNEPLNEAENWLCADDDLNKPPYTPGIPGGSLTRKTLCLDSIQHWGGQAYSHYDLHNLYGHSMAHATYKIFKQLMDKKRKLLTSQSTFVGTGQFSGHWIEGFDMLWKELKSSIDAVLNYNLYGFSTVGISMSSCNWNDPILALRWLQLTVFFPLTMLHVCYLQQLPVWPSTIGQALHEAVLQKYELLPYLYTLMYEAHTGGSAVVRALSYEFPNDVTSRSVTHQFLLGRCLLISPLLHKDASYLKFYLPKGTWYDFYSGRVTYSRGDWFNNSAASDHDRNRTAVHIRAGCIVTLQRASITALESRKEPFRLIVALNSSFEASGVLFWDDGNSRDSIVKGKYRLISFAVSKNILTVSSVDNRAARFVDNAYAQNIKIYGLSKNPTRVSINDKYDLVAKQIHWNFEEQVLELRNIIIRLEGTTQVKWFF